MPTIAWKDKFRVAPPLLDPAVVGTVGVGVGVTVLVEAIAVVVVIGVVVRIREDVVVTGGGGENVCVDVETLDVGV
jgi:hypothetical protein